MNLAIMASGRGSNAAAILNAIARDAIDARAVALITNREDIGALDVARAHNVPGYTALRRDFPSRDAQHQHMLHLLRTSGADFVALAGFTSILRPPIVAAYPNRILNIHPSLLPAFAGGMAPEPQAAALRAGVKISGCTVHVVTEESWTPGPSWPRPPSPSCPAIPWTRCRIGFSSRSIGFILWPYGGSPTDRARIVNGHVHIDSEENQALWPHPAR